MKLTIGNQKIALPVDAKISIEKSSPLLNDDTGSFSFPFPVPTLPNQMGLGWPGSLQRSGEIPDQSFILEDAGLQVFRGEVDYDDVTAHEIGLILKSGYTEFTKKMEGKKLADFDYGSEPWPVADDYYVSMPKIFDKLLEWDGANTNDNGKYVVSPFWISPYSGSSLVNVNPQFWGEPGITHLWIDFNPGVTVFAYEQFCLQFRVSFVLRKIFENAGYTIMEDMFSISEFKNTILYGKIFSINIQGISGGHATVWPAWESLQYSTLMPDIEILDFLDGVKNMFCLMFEIDELKKEIRIKFKKDVFLPENLDGMKIAELVGWTHKEDKALKGFALRYNSQGNDLDTKSDYSITTTVANALPAPASEGQIFHVTDYERDYVVKKNYSNVLEWQEIGRLKEYRDGKDENNIEISVTVPPQKVYSYTGTNLECPILASIVKSGDSSITPVTFLAFTLYHGRKTFGNVSYPYATFDKFSISGTINTGMSLKPSYLYTTVYSEFLNWQTYCARAFTKYIGLSLPQLVSLQWGKRYVINGLIVIIDKINFDLPYDGKVKIEGFTA